ncbi:MAG TPA: PilZ domain-containing protein [Bryobacterales bacterium]|nr:PilZ domain-containing protein [Bryobacterales bacterium]
MQPRPERYEIQRPVEFRVRNGGRPIQGHGRTLNISRGGLCFQTEDIPKVGDKIECVIEMGPGLVDDKESVNLKVHGITLRNSGGLVAVSIKKFRLRPIDSPDADDSAM